MDSFQGKFVEQRKDKSPKPKSPDELSQSRIMAMVAGSPHDFTNFQIKELKEEDFVIERRYQSKDGLLLAELATRQQDLDFNNPLNKSQKEFTAYLINRLIERQR